MGEVSIERKIFYKKVPSWKLKKVLNKVLIHTHPRIQFFRNITRWLYSVSTCFPILIFFNFTVFSVLQTKLIETFSFAIYFEWIIGNRKSLQNYKRYVMGNLNQIDVIEIPLMLMGYNHRILFMHNIIGIVFEPWISVCNHIPDLL